MSRTTMSEDSYIRGRGYLYHGQWLGNDPAAFKEVSILKSDVEGMEINDDASPPFVRLITRSGREWIIFQVAPPKQLAPTPVKATVIDSQESLRKPKRPPLLTPPPKERK